MWCREHNQLEYVTSVNTHLQMQTGAGFHTLEGWIHIMTHQHEGYERPTDTVQGSHYCGNGKPTEAGNHKDDACGNPFCMGWETIGDNINRQACHSRFVEDPELEECICFPGILMPCIHGRAHLSHKEVRDEFMRHYNGINDERDDAGKRLNRLGKCPICNYEITTDKGGLRGYVSLEVIKLSVKHMGVRHGIKMEKLDGKGT